MSSPGSGESSTAPQKRSLRWVPRTAVNPKRMRKLGLGIASFISAIAPWLTILGTVGLAVVSFDDARQQARPFFAPAIWEWGAANKLGVVVALALLTAAPALVSALYVRHQAILRETTRNVELTTAATSNSSRVAHLITKIGDVRRGEIDTKYTGYTLVEACNYFKTRAMHTSGAGPNERVEAYLMRAVKNGKGTLYFERLRQTHTSGTEFSYNLSPHKNSAAASIIDDVLGERGYVFASDEPSIARVREAFKIQGAASPFCQFLIVPVRKDRKIADRRDVAGVLVLMSTAAGMLRETDEALLATYSWYIAAANALNGRADVPDPPTTG